MLYNRCPHNGCEHKFLTINALASHLKAHQNKRDFVCHYEGCGKIFDKQCRLNQHIRGHTGLFVSTIDLK